MSETDNTESSRMQELKDFLRKVRINKNAKSGHEVVHTGNYVTKPSDNFMAGNYNVADEHKEKFFKLVNNAVYEGNILTIAEKSTAYGPLRVDFDFKAPLEVGLKRQYNEKILKEIVGFYQSEIKKIADKGEYSDDILTCIVLEKESPRKEGSEIKDGFHFHFPKFICDARVQDYYLRDRVTELMVKNKTWKKCKLTTEVEKIIDERMWNKPWMLYGSANVKDETSTAYAYNRRQSDIEGFEGKDPWRHVDEGRQWGHVYNHELVEIPMQNAFEIEMEGRKSNVRYCLPMLMSIRGEVKCTPITTNIEAALLQKGLEKKKHVEAKDAECPKVRSSDDINDDLELIRDAHFMDMLSQKRADNHDLWMDVGWTLFNIFNGQVEGLNMWREFSMRSAKFEDGECERRWIKMEMRGRTIEALKTIARKDSPNEYSAWSRTSVSARINESLKPKKANEYDVSLVVQAKQGDRFRCINLKRSSETWVEFRDHRWRSMDGEIPLRKFLVKDIIHEYKHFKANIARKEERMEEDSGEGDTKEISKGKLLTAKAYAVMENIKTGSFQNKVINQCKLHMSDELFMEKMDANRKLMCCENGVFDLELGIFREGRPDDYCTMSTKQTFKNYDRNDDDLLYLEDLLSKTFVNVNIRNYVLDVICSCMEGGNVHKLIIMFTGEGHGGKSKFIKLLEHAFGDYFGKFPRQTLMKGCPTSAGGPRADLAQIHGKRIMSTQELTDHNSFDIGFLKEISGDDSIYVRGMFEVKGKNVMPQCTCIIQFNEPPKLDGDNPAWDRVRTIPCESKFVIPRLLDEYPVPDDPEEQRKMGRFHADIYLDDKMKQLAPAMLWKLFNHYVKVYKKNGSKLRECNEVKLATDAYRLNNDVYKLYCKTFIKKIEDEETAKTAYISETALIEHFKLWCNDNYPTFLKGKRGENGNKLNIQNEFRKRYKPKASTKDIYGFEKYKYWGYNIKLDENEEERDGLVEEQVGA